MATFVAHMHIQVEPQRCGRHDDEITFKIICRYSINAGCSAHATTENGVMHHIQTVDVFPPNQPEYEIIKKKKNKIIREKCLCHSIWRTTQTWMVLVHTRVVLDCTAAVPHFLHMCAVCPPGRQLPMKKQQVCRYPKYTCSCSSIFGGKMMKKENKLKKKKPEQCCRPSSARRA